MLSQIEYEYIVLLKEMTIATSRQRHLTAVEKKRLVVSPLPLRSQDGNHWGCKVSSVSLSTFLPLWVTHPGTWYGALHYAITVSVNTLTQVWVRKNTKWDIVKEIFWFCLDFEFGTAEFGIAEFGIPKCGTAEFVIAEFGIPEFGTAEFGMAEFGIPEFGLAEFGIPEFGTAEFGIADFGIPEFGMAEFGIPEFGIAEFYFQLF